MGIVFEKVLFRKLKTAVEMKLNIILAGADPGILKRGMLYVGHHGWPAKKILGFRLSKKAEITLETINIWQNISIIIFDFSQFLFINLILSIFPNSLTLW